MADSPPLDIGSRWATVTSDDRSGILYIVAFLSFTYSSLTFITRCFIKWRVLGLDDLAMLVAQVASLVQFALLLISLSTGLGKNFDILSQADYASLVSAQLGNQIALYVSLGFSKIATVLLTQRLFTRDMKKAWVLCNIVTVLVVAWTALAPFLVSVGCSPESLMPAMPSQTCPSIVARYKFIVITDAITDLILVIIPAYLCWQLQMSVALKLQVLAVFAFRLPLAGLAGLFLKTWMRSLHSTNPGIHRTPAVIYQQAELCVSLMAATIPCLKSFIRSFDTGSGVKASFGSSNDYGSGDRPGNSGGKHVESYKLTSMRRSIAGSPRSRSRTQPDGDDGKLRVSSKPFASTQLGSATSRSKGFKDAFGRQTIDELDRQSQGSSQGLCIKREMQWEVTTENMRRGSDTNNPGMLRLPR